MKNTKKQAGFTLVELAIVLVIIGLIVGGVLAGQDLIKAAEIRSAVSQLERFDTAVNTFRGKYNGLPGDSTTAANFGFDTTGVGADGDGQIDSSADDGTTFDTEATAFFRHLAQANLVSETIGGVATFAAGQPAGMANVAPASKTGRGTFWFVNQTGGTNYYFLGAPTLATGALTFNAGTEVPVIDAMNLDTKLDDGFPTTGKIIAVTDMNSADTGAAAADDICVNTTPAPDAYNTGTTARQNDAECTIRIRASF